MAGPDSSGQAGDRFGFTLFLSLSVHAVLILGVGFSHFSSPEAKPSLEITLAQYRSPEAPESADFLAQENQQGGGTLDEAASPATTEAALFHDTQINETSPLPRAVGQTSTLLARSTVLTADESEPSVPRDRQQAENPDDPATDEQNREVRNLTLASLQAQLDNRRQAYAKRPRRYTISSASTQRSRDAEYLDSWRKRIEAVGNRHYPSVASERGLYGNLRLVVALRPDGSVKSARILRSSGHALLDEAAIRIVHLAAPFDPFPDSLRKEADLLEVVRTWQFQPGDTFSSR